MHGLFYPLSPRSLSSLSQENGRGIPLTRVDEREGEGEGQGKDENGASRKENGRFI
jgi:hypothetical protein